MTAVTTTFKACSAPHLEDARRARPKCIWPKHATLLSAQDRYRFFAVGQGWIADVADVGQGAFP